MSRWQVVKPAVLVRCAACGVKPLARYGSYLYAVYGDESDGYWLNIHQLHRCVAHERPSNTTDTEAKDTEANGGMKMTQTDARQALTVAKKIAADVSAAGLAGRPRATPTAAAVIARADEGAVLAWIASGDLSGLKPEQIKSLYLATCETLQLNPLTRPFDLLYTLGRSGGGDEKPRLGLYPNHGAAEQLGAQKHVSVRIVRSQFHQELGLYEVVVEVRTADGRSLEDVAWVAVSGKSKDGSYTLSGQRLGDTLMKAVTKARRRATLAFVGLGGLTGDVDVEAAQPVQVTDDWRVVSQTTGELLTAVEPVVSQTTGRDDALVTSVVSETTPTMQAQTDGMDAVGGDSVVSPPFPASCADWVLLVQRAETMEDLRAVSALARDLGVAAEWKTALRLAYGARQRVLIERRGQEAAANGDTAV